MSYSARVLPPADDPHKAIQQRSRRLNYHVLKAKNFAEYRSKAEDLLGHVLIFDERGNRLAGPMSVEAADLWLARAALGIRTRTRTWGE